jgi:hypothetical protein
VSSGPSGRPFCSEVSRENAEPLGATASRIDQWLLVEYRGVWNDDALAGSGLSDQVKARLVDLVASRHRTRLLLIRRPDRRRQETLAVYVADSRVQSERLARLEIRDHEQLLTLDPWRVGEPVDGSIFLVCTHGKHDRCCARYGRPLWQAVSEQLDEEAAWQCTHVGGDRFAGNLVVLPEGVYYGRVDREDVSDLVDRHLDGELSLDHYRGRSCWPFPVQAAERRIRAEEGLTSIADLRLARATREGDRRWTVGFETRVGRREVDVVEEAGELTLLTCSSAVARRPRRYVAMPR